MVLCHQITSFSLAWLDYPLCLRVNAKFLRCQCNGSKHLMLRVLLAGRNFSWYYYHTNYHQKYQLIFNNLLIILTAVTGIKNTALTTIPAATKHPINAAQRASTASIPNCDVKLPLSGIIQIM